MTRCLVTQGPKWMCLFERQETLQEAEQPPLILPPSRTFVTRPLPTPTRVHELLCPGRWLSSGEENVPTDLPSLAGVMV